jgi:hypothetical protein
MVLVISTLLPNQTVMAQVLQAPPSPTPNACQYCPSPQALHALAQQRKDLDLCQMNLVDTQAAFNKCTQDGVDHIQWFQSPVMIVGGMAVSFSLGAALIATKCFGLCK